MTSMASEETKNRLEFIKSKILDPEGEDEDEESELPERLDTESPDENKCAVGVACVMINCCFLATITLISLYKDAMVKDMSKLEPGNDDEIDKLDSAHKAFVSVASLTAPITITLLVYFGPRITSFVGGILIGSGLLASSFCKTSALIGLTLTISGLGTSFISLAAVTTYLEKFKNRRLLALAIYYLIPMAVIIAIVVIIIFNNVEDWRLWIRWQAGIVSTLVCLASLRLGKSKYDRSKYKELFSDCKFYVFLLVAFFDLFGRQIVNQQWDNSIQLIRGAGKTELILLSLSPTLTPLVGLLTLLCWKLKTYRSIILVIGCFNLTVGVVTLIIPPTKSSGWFFVYATIAGYSKGLITALMQYMVPTCFGEENIKIVSGFFSFSTGVAKLVSEKSSEAITEANRTSRRYSEYFQLYYFMAAGFIVISGLLALVGCGVPSKQSDSPGDNSKEEERNEDDTQRNCPATESNRTGASSLIDPTSSLDDNIGDNPRIWLTMAEVNVNENDNSVENNQKIDNLNNSKCPLVKLVLNDIESLQTEENSKYNKNKNANQPVKLQYDMYDYGMM